MSDIIRRVLSWRISVFLIIFLVFALLQRGIVCAAGHDFLQVRASAVILADGESGRILYTQNPDELLPTASMAKMMTEYLVLGAIKEGRISWEQMITVSDYAYRISQNLTLSNVPLRRNGQYSVRELYEAMAIYSANGATICLAELIGGTEGNFIRMMSDQARELGLEKYRFVNSTGLNNRDLRGEHPPGTGAEEENMMSARDTARLAWRLIRDHPEVFEFSSIPKKRFREGTSDEILMSNWNYMLPELIYGYEGVDGLKTGSTELAGYSFTGTAQRGGVRLLSVVMKASSIRSRFAETKKLLDYGFANYSKNEIAPAGFQLAGESELPVVGGRELKVGVAAEKPLAILVKKGEEKLYQPIYRLDETLLTKEKALVAPVPKGKVVGKVGFTYTGADGIEYLTAEGEELESVNLVTTMEAPRAGLLTRLFRGVGRFFSGLWQRLLKAIGSINK